MCYNPPCLDEQNTEALCFTEAAETELLASKAPSMYGLTSSAVRLGNGSIHGGRFVMSWEVDWGNPNNKWPKVWARDTENHISKCREWGLVSAYTLRRAGVNTPTFRADSWEVDWDKRNKKMVWARNPNSKMPTAREWHWVDFHTIDRAGMKWKPAHIHTGRYTDSNGYVLLTRMGMTTEDIAISEKYFLFRGARKAFVREHHLVAVKKYQCILDGLVVRHVNGIKSDNRPENIIIGTTQENTMDHNTARLMAMYWHRKYIEAISTIKSGEAAVEISDYLERIK